MKKTKIAFHAKDDRPEVREKFYKLIVDLDFKAEFFVARKIENVFKKRHRGKEYLFYDDMVSKLFENKLHKAQNNYIYFAVRGDKKRQEPLEDAIQAAINKFEKKWNKSVQTDFSVMPQSPAGEPCLQIADYMNWAVQRVFEKREMRYYRFVEDKVSYLVDIYDFDKYPKNFYHRGNRFNLNKISPL